MAVVGYARVSTSGQDYETQVERLKAFGADKIFSEKKSGLDGKRPELLRCLEYVREGDTLVVTKLDRLARSTADLYRMVTELGDKGVAFKVLDDPLVDTTSRTGKLVMGVLALIAEFEADIRKERQMEGIAKAKARGAWVVARGSSTGHGGEDHGAAAGKPEHPQDRCGGRAVEGVDSEGAGEIGMS